MNEISFDLFDKEELEFDIDTTIKKVYPPLENLYVVPSGEVQNFKSEDYYGYDTVTVNPVLLQNKEVTPTKEQQVVKADEEFSGLNEVIVNAISDEYVVPKVVENTLILSRGEVEGGVLSL